MRLSASPSIDIRQRFRDELRTLQLPKAVSLVGNAMQAAVAELLLKEHGIVVGQGPQVQLMSMEAYCSAFLKSFMEEAPPPSGIMLLTTIPEDALIAFAKEHDIPVVCDDRDDVRRMLDSIAASQPQTYFSLRRSSDRLKAAAEMLRARNGK